MKLNYVSGTITKPFGAKQAVGIFLAYILTMIAVGSLVSIVAAQFFGPKVLTDEQSLIEASGGATIILRQFVGLLAAAGITFYLLRFYFPGSIKEGALSKIGWVKCKTEFVVAAGIIGFALALIFARVLGKIYPPNEDFVPSALMAATQTGNWIQYLTAFMAVCVAPAVEELLFRGILYKGFSESWGKLVAGVLIFILFILLHNETLAGGYWVSIMALVLVSLFLIIAREISGSLIPPVILHLGFNFALVLPA